MKKYVAAPFLFCITVTLLFSPQFSYGGDMVSLDVQVVYASSDKEYVDATLVGLKEKLSRLFSYTSFEIISKMRKEAGKGETAQFSIPGARNMEIIPGEIGQERVKLDVAVSGEKGSLMRTALKMERGSIVIVGGPEFKSGVLIILISAD